jgi:outer membrane protein TolC
MPAGIHNKLATLRLISLGFISLWLIMPGPAIAALDLQQAVAIALQSDPEVNRHLAREKSWQLNAVAENQLPDPKLRLGLSNVPTDSFDLEQEPMTQASIGIEQAFLRGDTLELRQAQAESNASIEQLEARLSRLNLVRDVRLAYLDVYMQVQSAAILKKSRALFKQVREITQSQYSAGRARQQDVLRAELELGRLQDREIKTRVREDEARANLAQWLGETAWQALATEFPQAPEFHKITDIDTTLLHHPAVAKETAMITAQQYTVKIAEQQYKPGFSLGLDYRKRFGENPDGSDRSNMLALLASVDLPLFSENRQDKRVAASQEQVNAAHYQRAEAMRKLKRVYQNYSAQLERQRERQTGYLNSLLKSARENTKASLRAYQSGVTEFNTLMRASITELEVMLDALRVDVDVAIAEVQLDYITGGEQ